MISPPEPSSAFVLPTPLSTAAMMAKLDERGVNYKDAVAKLLFSMLNDDGGEEREPELLVVEEEEDDEDVEETIDFKSLKVADLRN